MSQLCPESFKKRALALSHNGFLFQFSENKLEFYLCRCKELTDQEVEEVKQISGSSTLRCDEWIGHPYMAISWTEFGLIDKILTAMLQKGHRFTTLNELELVYHPGTDNEFIFDKMEEKFISWIQTHLNPKESFLEYLIDMKFRLLDEWNWNTQKGKDLCRELRQLKYGRDQPYSKDDLESNYKLWPLFQNYDKKTLMDLPGNIVPAIPVKNLNPETECLVCLANPPTVVFFPCEHVVICTSCLCSNSNHELTKKCIKCREDIKLFTV